MRRLSLTISSVLLASSAVAWADTTSTFVGKSSDGSACTATFSAVDQKFTAIRVQGYGDYKGLNDDSPQPATIEFSQSDASADLKISVDQSIDLKFAKFSATLSASGSTATANLELEVIGDLSSDELASVTMNQKVDFLSIIPVNGLKIECTDLRRSGR